MSALEKLKALEGLAKNRPVIKDSPTTVRVSDEFNAQPIEEVVAETQAAVHDLTIAMRGLVEESKK